MAGSRHVLCLINSNTGASKSFLFHFSRRLSPSASRSTTCRPLSDSRRRYSSRASTGSKESHGGHFGTEERAPSTLEEFERLSEEKEESDRLCKAKEERRQGFVSQTAEKVVQEEEGASLSAASRDPKVETVKEHIKEPVGVGNFHRKTGED